EKAIQQLAVRQPAVSAQQGRPAQMLEDSAHRSSRHAVRSLARPTPAPLIHIAGNRSGASIYFSKNFFRQIRRLSQLGRSLLVNPCRNRGRSLKPARTAPSPIVSRGSKPCARRSDRPKGASQSA